MRSIMKTPLAVLMLAAFVAAAATAAKPNVLLIVADDLGYSDLGCYGGEIETPSLDSLAAGGLRLTRFYNTGRCCPSRAAILTGQYPHRVGLGHMTQDIGQPGYRGRVSSDAVTIAQMLAKSNYRSFIAGKWHLGTDDPNPARLRGVLWDAGERENILGSRSLCSLARWQGSIEFQAGDFLWHRCSHGACIEFPAVCSANG